MNVTRKVDVQHMHSKHDHGSLIGNEGLFLSHSYLGFILFALGCWWWIQSLRRYYSKVVKNTEYFASVAYESSCGKNQLGEGLIKIVLCLFGFGIESLTLKLGHHKEYACFPFYATFLLSGILDVLMASLIAPPMGLDYVACALPFFSESYYIRAQSYDQPHVTQTCRLLTSYWAFITGLSIMAEMQLNQSLLWTWLKCFALTFHGTWLWQAAFILNPPFKKPWDEHNHNNLMYVAILFSWHMFFVLLFQLIALLIVAKCYRIPANYGEECHFKNKLNYNPVHNDSHQRVIYARLLNEE